MRVIFLTNQASYHQMHYARAMVAHLGAENFRIVFQKPTSAARAEMGWSDEYSEPYILRFWASEEDRADALDWIEQADVVIQGRFPIRYVRARIKRGQLTFACQERLWKKKPSFIRRLSRLPHLYKNYYSVNKPNYQFLAIGAYAAQDLNQMGIFKGRSWQFGYFIDVSKQPRQVSGGESVELLWCARFSAVKQPDVALEILQSLRQQGLDARLTMIGDGELKTAIQEKIVDRSLQSFVTMTGWQTQEQVLQHMLKADLFLMTSHHGEGWGMVVNEAMSHGCAVMANEQLGSAGWLIKHQQNGFLYSNVTLQHVVTSQVATMKIDAIRALGDAAFQQMESLWSASVAAARSLEVFEALLNKEPAVAQKRYSDGPFKSID